MVWVLGIGVYNPGFRVKGIGFDLRDEDSRIASPKRFQVSENRPNAFRLHMITTSFLLEGRHATRFKSAIEWGCHLSKRRSPLRLHLWEFERPHLWESDPTRYSI